MDFYKLLDSGSGEKLEQWGKHTLVRPDPQIIWQKSLDEKVWDEADAIYREQWLQKSNMPSDWQLNIDDLAIEARLTPFKHTGVFPEQYEQWQWIKTLRPKNVLNLFGYTGIASLVAASVGASVTHVDGSSQAIGWARKNQELSGLLDKPIRWMLDDVLEFAAREVRRGHTYDLILLDPPVFGHGPDGQTWQFTKSLPKLMESVKQLLAPDAVGVLINAYAVTTSAYTLQNILQDLTVGMGGKITCGETLIKQENSERVLSTGIWGKWSK